MKKEIWINRPCMLLFLIMLAFVSACQAPIEIDVDNIMDYAPEDSQKYREFDEWRAHNPCGGIQIRLPLVNVTGYLTQSVREKNVAYLFLTPNVSLNASLFVVENCAPIGKFRISNGKYFALGSLPFGHYVIMLPRSAFGFGQGFPIVDEISNETVSVEFVFQGGGAQYSIGVFTIAASTNMDSHSRILMGLNRSGNSR